MTQVKRDLRNRKISIKDFSTRALVFCFNICSLIGFACGGQLAAVPRYDRTRSLDYGRYSDEVECGLSGLENQAQGTGAIVTGKLGRPPFLTSASEDGKERYVFCLDRNNGKIIWGRMILCKSPEHPHNMNSYAIPSCATNGKRVVAFFGPAGIHCFDFEGEKKWSRELGAFPGPWGVAASPIILGDLVIQNCDAEGASSLIALSLEEGELVWQTKREEKPREGGAHLS